jgi:hypothetical protein
MIEAALYDLLNETIKIEKLLSTEAVNEYFDRTATFDNRFSRSDKHYSFGSGPVSCFIFSTEQVGETASGTGLVSLVNLLQRGTCNFRKMQVTWHFAPNLNLNDNQSITAFRNAIRKVSPDLVCSIETRPGAADKETASFRMRRGIADKQFNLLRTIFAKSGIQLTKHGCDPIMGPGFFIVKPVQEPLLLELQEKSQFFQISMSCDNSLAPADQVFLLMAATLIAIDSETGKNCAITEES